MGGRGQDRQEAIKAKRYSGKMQYEQIACWGIRIKALADENNTERQASIGIGVWFSSLQTSGSGNRAGSHRAL